MHEMLSLLTLFDPTFDRIPLLGMACAYHMNSSANARAHQHIVASLGAALSILSMDVDFFGPQCSVGAWNGVTIFFVQVFLPFAFAAFFGVLYVIRCLFASGCVEHGITVLHVHISNDACMPRSLCVTYIMYTYICIHTYIHMYAHTSWIKDETIQT
jgi:hypothetical protein